MQSTSSALHTLLKDHRTGEFLDRLKQEAKVFASQINAVNEHGLTLLQLAAREGLTDVVVHLCFAGADINQTTTEIKHENPAVKEEAGRTAPQHAAKCGHELIVKILQAFHHDSAGEVVLQTKDETILKALYVWAVRYYSSPAGLILPDKPSKAIKQGLLELAAFLNKPLWADYFLTESLRHNCCVYTPAYWAAINNNEELLKKLAVSKENLFLTLWQLKQNRFDALYEKYAVTVQAELEKLFDAVPEENENIAKKYRAQYLAAAKNDRDLIVRFSYETRREIVSYALQENNFVALVAMQQTFEKNKFDFLISLVHLPMIINFELVSQGIPYALFVTKFIPRLHGEFFQKHCNKVGLLNFLIGAHLRNGKLTTHEREMFDAVPKRDELVFKLALQNTQNRYPDNSPSSKSTLNELLKELGLYFLDTKMKLHIDQIPDRLVEMMIKYNNENVIFKQVSKRFYAITVGVKPCDSVTLQETVLRLDNRIKAKETMVNGLTQDLNLLGEFKANLLAENEQYVNIRNRICAGANTLGILGISAAFAANVVCIVKFVREKTNAIKLLKSLNVTVLNATYTCYDWYKQDKGCDGHPGNNVALPVPVACNDFCSISYDAENNFGGSLATGIIIGIFGSAVVICLFYRCREAYNNKLYSSVDNLYKSLKGYSKDLQQKLLTISPLLLKQKDSSDPATAILDEIETTIPEKNRAHTKQTSFLSNLKERRSIFAHFPLFKEPIKEAVIEIKEEAPAVAAIGSLNDNPAAPLLEKEPTARKSICSSCVIL